MGLPPRSRPSDDDLPSETPAYPELEAIRYELPVKVAGARGTLVIRWFTGHGRFALDGTESRPNDGEMSIRGTATGLLKRL